LAYTEVVKVHIGKIAENMTGIFSGPPMGRQLFHKEYPTLDMERCRRAGSQRRGNFAK